MKQEFRFDDWMLGRAMHAIMDEDVAALPSDAELRDTIEVSDLFQRKMSALTKQTKHRIYAFRAMKALAAVFVVALLVLSVRQLKDAGFFAGGDEATTVEEGAGGVDGVASSGSDSTDGVASSGSDSTDGAASGGSDNKTEPATADSAKNYEILIQSIRDGWNAIAKVFFPDAAFR